MVKQKGKPDSLQVYHLEIASQIFYPGQPAKPIVEKWHTTSGSDTFNVAFVNGTAPLIIPDYQRAVPGVINDSMLLKKQAIVMTLPTTFWAKRNALRFAAGEKNGTRGERQMILAAGLEDEMNTCATGQL